MLCNGGFVFVNKKNHFNMAVIENDSFPTYVFDLARQLILLPGIPLNIHSEIVCLLFTHCGADRMLLSYLKRKYYQMFKSLIQIFGF